MATKVSQATIDKIKKMGMTKALASAKTNKSAEFQEGLRRMYGARRVSAAMGSAVAAKKTMSKASPMSMERATAARKTIASKKPKIQKSVVSAATAAKNRAAMKERMAASKDKSTKTGQRASESKTMRGVNTMVGNRFKKDMTPKQRQVARLRAQEQGKRSSKVAGRVSSVLAGGMGPGGLLLGAAGQTTSADKKKMKKSADKYYTIDRKTGKRK
jgi:hypothetical protein